MEFPKDRTIIASDVSDRDGIGVEIYRDNELVVEIFKKEIPWDFINYNDLNK